MLLSRGANPDIQTSRGNLTPLHLACGAGNYAIAELLVRHGCALNVPDCFGSFPIDHAIRNGFPDLVKFLQAQILKERALKSAGLDITMQDDQVETADGAKNAESDAFEQEKFLLQSAFSNLSLKDKLIFNMMVKKRGQHSRKVMDNNLVVVDEALEEEEEEEEEEEQQQQQQHQNGNLATEEVVTDPGGDVQMKNSDGTTSGKKGIRKRGMNAKQNAWEVESVDSVLTDNDKESLDIAMKLMNPEVRSQVFIYHFLIC